MRKRKKITTKLGLLLLLLAALVMVMLPFQAWAQEADTDGDGILDNYEGLCLPESASNCGITNIGIPDLFIQLVKDSNSTLPEYLFDFITAEQPPFNMNVHVIGEADAPDQHITPEQYAVRLKESIDENDGDLGVTPIGVPTQKRSGTVYTRRIRNDVDKACSLQPTCIAVNSDGNVVAQRPDEIFNYYVKEVFAHETFHALGRVVPKDRKADYHYPMLGYIMDPYMSYKESKKDKTVTWTIQNRWAYDDAGNLVDVARFK